MSDQTSLQFGIHHNIIYGQQISGSIVPDYTSSILYRGKLWWGKFAKWQAKLQFVNKPWQFVNKLWQFIVQPLYLF